MILLRLQVIKLLLFGILINPNDYGQEFARLTTVMLYVTHV